jgi:hydrogenase maturation protease
MYCLCSSYTHGKKGNIPFDHRINAGLQNTNTGSKKNILVIGVGNVLLKDEGAGIHTIKRIQADAKEVYVKNPGVSFSRPDVEFITGDTSGLDILEQFKGRDKIIIIDAAQTIDPPGTLYRLEKKDLNIFNPGEKVSMHNINLHDIVNLASFLGQAIPDIIIIAVNVKDITPGESLTKEVESKIPEIIALVYKEILFTCATQS